MPKPLEDHSRWFQWVRGFERATLITLINETSGQIARMAGYAVMKPERMRGLLIRHGLLEEAARARNGKPKPPFDPDLALAVAQALAPLPTNVVDIDQARQARTTAPAPNEDDAPEPEGQSGDYPIIEVPIVEGDDVDLPETTEEIDANDDAVAVGPDAAALTDGDAEDDDDDDDLDDDDDDLDEDDDTDGADNDQSA